MGLMNNLSESERDLLKWLSKEDYSQYGECYGKDLDKLIIYGLAQVHGPGENQSFIAKEPLDRDGKPILSEQKAIFYRAVSLTKKGWQFLKYG
jgi:hypothetical protein